MRTNLKDDIIEKVKDNIKKMMRNGSRKIRTSIPMIWGKNEKIPIGFVRNHGWKH